MHPVLIGGLAVAVLVIAGVAAYYIIRYMKGSIKFTMPRTGFGAGEMVTGSFELAVKKPIQGNRLVVSLIGDEIETYYRDGKRRTRSREVYRDEKVIEDARSYQPGHRAVHEFEIQAPSDGSSQVPSEVPENAVLQTVVGVAKALSGRRRRLKWRIEARLDAKGVDLATSKSVTINMPSRL